MPGFGPVVEGTVVKDDVPPKIHLNRFCLTGQELVYIEEAITGGHIMGDGPFTRRCEALLEEATGARKAFLTTSCTDALEMAALLLEIRPGDEVIVPSFAFASTANAFVSRGARPVFADVRPDTLNLDEDRLEAHITPRTKAIVALHYAGVACEMDAILEMARDHQATVVEDNAHGLMGSYRGRNLGSLGALAALSFHETKNFTCGEGGALLVNADEFLARAEVLRDKGTDRARFLRNEVDQYTWVDVGSSFLPSDLLAAFLCAQLEERSEIQAKRRTLWQGYYEGLGTWAEANGVALPTVPAHCESACHSFHLLLPTEEDQRRLTAHLAADHIVAAFHYLPLHLSRMGRRYGGKEGDCPVSEKISGRLLRVPLHGHLTAEDQQRVIRSIEMFSCRVSAGNMP